MAKNPIIEAHLEWLGYVQPVGLVVSPHALQRAQAVLNLTISNPDSNVAKHADFVDMLEERELEDGGIEAVLPDFVRFATQILDWRESDLNADSATLDALSVPLPEYGETLRPTRVVPDEPKPDGTPQWMMLIQQLPAGTDLDALPPEKDQAWHASPQARFERLLRETGVPIGLLFNHSSIRLVYAPRGESSGFITFRIQPMSEVSGRSIFGALHLLLNPQRLFSLPDGQRLPDILRISRKFQNEVSTKLARQVLNALYELVKGFQSADNESKGTLLKDVLAQDPNKVYEGLLTVLMRLVFTLYAEHRGLMPNHEAYAQYYAISGLYERLRADAGRYPDTMDRRYGAWAQLLSLFRLIYDGGGHGPVFKLPARHGHLFDPDRFPFLEGRPLNHQRHEAGSIDLPRVPDGVIFRVLEDLLILQGERLSYRTLDVEQIGSVYETMMGFRLELTTGRSLAIKPSKSHGASSYIDAEKLLQLAGEKRVKQLTELTDWKPGKQADGIKQADTVEELLAACDRKLDKALTPTPVPPRTMVLQPTDERRKSGSHYTPRSLTEPIVRKTLEPILNRLGEHPTPEQILDLKVCDPAMGSGAFLVEACRQLGDELVKAWHHHRSLPYIPPDEDEILHARRVVAQRCLYGVDKNPMAVDLSKLSLWLATLAKDHPFTFLDHSLRAGDALVGLSRLQIARFHWDPKAQREIGQKELEDKMEAVSRYRREILDGGDDPAKQRTKAQKLRVAEQTLQPIRDAGDLVIAAFFGADKPRAREELRNGHLHLYNLAILKAQVAELPKLKQIVADLRSGDKPVPPFHWEIEFPEAFSAGTSGFDAFVGNPPYVGGTRLEPVLGRGWRDFVVQQVAGGMTGTRGAGDLAAYFLRRAHSLSAAQGCVGFVTTNTICQGDTREIGLAYLLAQGAEIYFAVKSLRWPGEASIEVANVCISKRAAGVPPLLDGVPAHSINSLLRDGPELQEPVALLANKELSFEGAKLIGDGFIVSCEEGQTLVHHDRRYGKVVLPFYTGEDITSTPDSRPRRMAINFWDWPLNRRGADGSSAVDVAEDFPLALEIVAQRVRPFRMAKPPDSSANRVLRERWWQYYLWRPAMYHAIEDRQRVLVRSRVSNTHGLVFVSPKAVLADTNIVFAFDAWPPYTVLQSTCHETWAIQFASTLGNTIRYTPTSCFQTFPFPSSFESDPTLEATGKAYYEFRADLMVRNDEGLTKTYNRFHDPAETSPDIHKLRGLHAAMDRAVLDAYGWQDIQPVCGFGLDYLELDDDAQVSPEAQQVIDSGNLWFPTAEQAQAFAIGIGHTGRKRLPWRYRWPEETRDEVLARLLDLNAQRAKEEQLSGAAAQANEKKKAKGRKPQASKPKGKQMF